MYRIKVLSPIVYRNKELPAGRLIRADRSSAPFFLGTYGDAVAEWNDWPNRATEPFSQPMQYIGPVDPQLSSLDLEGSSWEDLEDVGSIIDNLKTIIK